MAGYFKNFRIRPRLPSESVDRKFPVDFWRTSLGNLPQVSWIVDRWHLGPSTGASCSGECSVVDCGALMPIRRWGEDRVLFGLLIENADSSTCCAADRAAGDSGEFRNRPAVARPAGRGPRRYQVRSGLGFRVPMLVISPWSRGDSLPPIVSITPRYCDFSKRFLGRRCRIERLAAGERWRYDERVQLQGG